MNALPDCTNHGFRIFDVHHHAGSIDAYFGSTKKSTDDDPAKVRQLDVEARLRFMDAWGIEHALLMPASGHSTTNGISDTQRSNDWVAEYRSCRSDRFPIAVGSVAPQDGDAAVTELHRCIDQLGMKGMVWHHRFLGCTINHPGMKPLLKILELRRVPAMIHVIAESTLESPWRLEILADEFAQLNFVALDAFSSPAQASWMQYIAKRHDNIYFDTGVLASAAHGLEKFIEVAGADKLLFGTDHYSSPQLFNTPFALYELLAASLADTVKQDILGDNARRLFELT